ncbi:MAG: hypothetical protein MUO64_07735 [Anaerolineales bacterium]|nr:hypothetical protein [Anaerolineales bacterium]
METRQGDGTEALSQETESNGSATPKSRRHPLTLPPDRLRRGYAVALCLQSSFWALSSCLSLRQVSQAVSPLAVAVYGLSNATGEYSHVNTEKLPM